MHRRDGARLGDDGTEQGAEDHRPRGAEHAAPVAGPEGLAGRGVGGQVARIVRDVRGVGDLPQDCDRDRRHEPAERHRAVAERAGRGALDEQRDDRHHEHDAAQRGEQLIDQVDHVVAEGADGEADERADDDPGVDGHAVDQLVDRLAAEHDIGGDEAEVHDDHHADDEQRAVAAELPAALDHLRDAQVWSLGGVQRHEHRAEQVADDEAEHRPAERQPVDGRGERSGDDREQHDVGAEPQREQVAHPPVTLGIRYLADRALLDRGRVVLSQI